MPFQLVESAGKARARIVGFGRPLIVVPVFNALAETARCMQSLMRHSPADTDILVIDDGSAQGKAIDVVESLGSFSQSVYLWRHEENMGFVRTMNEAFDAAGRRDVVLVNSDVEVGAEWLDRLTAAALSREQIASATPLTNHGTVLSVPKGRPSRRIPGDLTPEEAAAAVAGLAARRYPLIPVCVGHLVYFKRSALDLAGKFDEAFSPGYSEEIDWALRCTALGLQHVCADDVFVYHAGGASFDSDRGGESRTRGHDLIGERYEFYYRWMGAIDTSDDSLLAGAIACAEIALRGLRVLVDARNLELQLRHGTHRLTLEVVAALARHPRISEVVVLHRGPAPDQQLHGLPPEASPVRYVPEEEMDGFERADVAFRPYQVHGRASELATLKACAKRTILWQLDLISFSNLFYHYDWERWRELRDVTRLALHSVDGVAVLSHDVLQQARASGLPAVPDRFRVLFPGTDHRTPQPDPARPSSMPQSEAFSRFVLCFGTDYGHKNRPFALRVLASMREQGYRYGLIKAGSAVPFGSSREAEEELLSELGIGDVVRDLGIVREAERRWLLNHADLVLYPSLAEGFGLVPFEAARAGTPCLASRIGALGEILPPDAETTREWLPEAVASAALRLIDDESARTRQVEVLRRRGDEFTWDRFAEEFFQFAVETCGSAASPVLALRGESGQVIALRSEGPQLLRGAREAVDRTVKFVTELGWASHPVMRPLRVLLRLPYRVLVRLSEGRIGSPSRRNN